MKRYCFDEKPVVVKSRLRRMAYEARGIYIRHDGTINVSFDVTAETEPEADIIAENFLEFAANRVPFVVLERDAYRGPLSTFLVELDFKALDTFHKSVRCREYVKANREMKEIGRFPTEEFAVLYIENVIGGEFVPKRLRITNEQWMDVFKLLAWVLAVVWLVRLVACGQPS
jgi:hypothetical protein